MKKIKFLFGALAFLFAMSGCGDFIKGSIEAEDEGDDTPNYCTVNFDSQGGTLVSSITQLYGTVITLPAPTREGYVFNGWYSSTSSTGAFLYGGGGDGYTIVNASITMYARWTAITPNSYTITFNANGGNLSVVTRIEQAGTVITLPTPTRGSDTFNGWYSDDGNTRYGGAGDNYTVTGSVTMHAQWTTLNQSEFTVTFDSQGGISVSPITAAYGSNITIPTPTREGYIFDGWFGGVSSGVRYGGGGGSYTVIGDVTMYAHWIAIFYTVTFDSQGGSSVSTIMEQAGTSITLPAPTRANYNFSGWYSAASGGTKYGGSGDSYTLAGNVTMYAQWSPIHSDIFNITFDAQGGAVNPAFESGTYGTSITLPTPTRSGYTFNGWYNASSGGTKYNSPYTISGDVTMYAQWTAVIVGSDGDTTINGIECVLVKAGTFMMGVDDYFSYDVHPVTLTNDYWISKYPITQAQYQAVMDTNPSSYSGSNNPVERVTWYNANDFCQAVGGRLPTEAEWEFAARGGNKSQGYIYSGSNTVGDVAWYDGNNSPYGTKPVGQKLPNELGIYDMSGNVWEWCSDWYGSYPTGAVTNPTGPSSGSSRIARGGYWSGNAQNCRVADRDDHNPSNGNYYVGFRVAFPRN